MSEKAVYVDATTLIALGNVGELDLLRNFDGEIVILRAVRDEVTTQPALKNVETFVGSDEVTTEDAACEEKLDEARDVLGEDENNGDVWIVAGVLAHDEAAVVSDDRRVRTVANGFGATVTGTVGVIVRGVTEGMSEKEGKDVVRRVDEHGLHMTAELREKAYELVEEAATERN